MVDVASLSGGQLQKLSIILCSSQDADLFVYDEITSFLDIEERMLCAKFLVKDSMKDEKTNIVFDHDLSFISSLHGHISIAYGMSAAWGKFSGKKETSSGIHQYLDGFLKAENIRLHDRDYTYSPPHMINQEETNKIESSSTKVHKDNFSFTSSPLKFSQERITSIVGKNAIGKTTFVNELMKDSCFKNMRISLKKQILNYSKKITGEQFIADNLKACDVTLRKEIFKWLDLKIIIKKPLDALSGGELQRVSIANCFLSDSDVYFVDEPTAYLDIDQRFNVQKLMRIMCENYLKTFIVIDHDLFFLNAISDLLIVIRGIPGEKGYAKEVLDRNKGLNSLLKELNITIRGGKEKDYPKINKFNSLLDREQKSEGKYWK